MKHIPNVAGALLGLAFMAFGLMFLLDLVPEQPPPPEGSWAAMFMGSFVPSGYLTFVKVLETAGGLLVAIPRTRGLGLLVLGPILVNIGAFHVFIMEGVGATDPMILGLAALALVCLWAERGALLALCFKTGARAS